MSVSYSRARKRFDREQKQLEQEYLRAGMTQEQIADIQKFDLDQFNRDLAFMYRTQPFDATEDFDANEQNPLLEKFMDALACEDVIEEGIFSWLDEITVEPMASGIKKLSIDDKYLLTLLFKYEYTQQEICRHYDIDKSALSRRCDSLADALKHNTAIAIRHSSWFSRKEVVC